MRTFTLLLTALILRAVPRDAAIELVLKGFGADALPYLPGSGLWMREEYCKRV